MKEIKHSVYRKLPNIIATVITDYEYIKDINEVLSPEKLAANYWEWSTSLTNQSLIPY